LTIIGWWLAISAVLTAYSVLTIQSNTLAMQMLEKAGASLALHRMVGVVGTVVAVICAYGVLKGLPWARVLYVVWGVIALATTAFIMPIISVMAMSAVFLAIIAFFLFRPVADEWFAARGFQLHRNEA